MHIAAIVFYRVRHKDNLVIPMLNGDKNMVEPIESARDDSMSRAIALVVFAICVACVTWFVKWAG
jgi:hypothetical protein